MSESSSGRIQDFWRWVGVGLATLAFSWLFMQWTHEAGHVIGALVTGGEVERVVLDPRTFSRTDLLSNPRPLLVVWAGPVLGVLLGGALPIGVARMVRRGGGLLLVVAGLCMVANAAYIGVGAISPVADAEVMRRLGTPAWVLAVFGVVFFVAGRWLILRGIRQSRSDRAGASRMAWVLLVGSIGLAIAGVVWFPA